MNIKKALLNNTTKIWETLFQNLVSLWGVTFYFVVFSRFLPDGVNKTFSYRGGRYLGGLVVFLTVIFVIALKLRKKNLSDLRIKERYSLENWILVLLPLTPVLQYILNNRETLSLMNALYVFFVFAVLAIFFIILIPLLIGRFTSSRILMFLGTAQIFVLTYMAKLSREFAWHEIGSLKIQAAVFIGVFFLIWLFFYTKSEKILYFMIVVWFLSTGVTSVFVENKSQPNSDGERNNQLVQQVESRDLNKMPNIYLLIYDAYVSNETMLSYGIDNEHQEQYLKELGFKIYPYTYSIGCHSIGTMSRVLNASPDFYGNSRKGVSGDGVVQNLLKGFGYETYGLFTADYFFRGTSSSYDHSFPNYNSPAETLIKAILMGEFRFDVGFDVVPREQFLAVKSKWFSEVPEEPRFIYMHTKLPGHSQNSGACLPNETELYNERLEEANLEMKQDLRTLLEDDPNAIIIVAGDHGPYLTKNCTYTSFSYEAEEINRLDVQDRYGTFLAIRWPSQDFELYDDITVLQDIFPAVFAYLFQDESILEAKVDTITLDDYDDLSSTSGVRVVDGIIVGGIDDGEPLFLGVDE